MIIFHNVHSPFGTCPFFIFRVVVDLSSMFLHLFRHIGIIVDVCNEHSGVKAGEYFLVFITCIARTWSI
jgi:hypothetical protein